MSHSENCQKVHINREGISPLKLLIERSRLSSWIRLGKLLGTDQLKLVSNDLKTGPDWLVQSIELSTGPLSGSVQLLSRKGLRTDIESVVEPDKLVVEPPNRMEPNSSVQLRIWVFGPKLGFDYQWATHPFTTQTSMATSITFTTHSPTLIIIHVGQENSN